MLKVAVANASLPAPTSPPVIEPIVLPLNAPSASFASPFEREGFITRPPFDSAASQLFESGGKMAVGFPQLYFLGLTFVTYEMLAKLRRSKDIRSIFYDRGKKTLTDTILL